VQSDKPAAYTPEHATVMQMAANIAANAIENIRLLEEEQSRAERLMLSQRLESVGRLAGGIAHDFNNMLTAINGYSELTLRRLKEDDPLRRNIEEIKKAGERSAALTHQLLAFSRKQVLKPKILVLNDVILETSKMLQRLIGEDIHLNIIPDAKLGMVEADPGQLTQVIMNLVVNARDAMPSGGNLTIETANVSLTKKFAARQFTVRPGSYVMLSVSDTGVGMDAETQQYIFEPFFTTKEVGKGTGLGLATVYGIVKQSGGYVWAYSEPGKGSTFKIYLPRVDVNVRELKEEPIPESVPNGTETILLVEDEEMVRNLSRQILETCGYRILEARNGVEALTICQKFDSKIDLLMTDVVMPQMGGRELAEKLSQMYPQIRLLFTSGYTDDGIIRLGVIKTGDNFIQKPFSFETLAKKVRDLLDAKNGR
jgi:two-component system, cell cycle sensor histidine kinase and response regulator CckA